MCNARPRRGSQVSQSPSLSSARHCSCIAETKYNTRTLFDTVVQNIFYFSQISKLMSTGRSCNI